MKIIANKSRAEYFKERRKSVGQFSVPVERERLEKLDEKLKSQSKTKTAWLKEKIDEEIGDKK